MHPSFQEVDPLLPVKKGESRVDDDYDSDLEARAATFAAEKGDVRRRKASMIRSFFYVVVALGALLGVVIWRSSFSLSSTTSNDDEKAWSTPSTLPHIVLFYADDQGWNDLGYQSEDLSRATPHLDSLAATGIKLATYYGMQVCTPSRAALLTGMYTIHTGMQHSIITGTFPYALPLDLAIMPEFLASLGYRCHMVGKWHLGHFREEHLPLARGFESHVGFYSGFQDHFTKISEVTICDEADDDETRKDSCFQDLRYGEAAANDQVTYAPALWRDAAIAIIENHAASTFGGSDDDDDDDGSSSDDTPLFLYYAESLVHEPVQAPEEAFVRYADALSNISNADRRIFGAMTCFMDEVASNVTRALQRSRLWNNTIFVYASDNGAYPAASGSGSNVPLRGIKSSLFEGGVRVPSFVHSPLLPLKSRTRVYRRLFHVSDWLPTLVGGVLGRSDLLTASRSEGGVSSETQLLFGYDGVDQWEALLTLAEDDALACVACGASSGEGSIYLKAPLTHNGSPRRELLIDMDYLGDGLNANWTGYDTAAIRVDNYKLITNEVNETWWPLPGSSEVKRKPVKDQDGGANDVFTFLFDLAIDPMERHNLADDAAYATIRADLEDRLTGLRAGMVSAMFCRYEDAQGADLVQPQSGFIEPWVTVLRESKNYTCRMRFDKYGQREFGYNPSYLESDSRGSEVVDDTADNDGDDQDDDDYDSTYIPPTPQPSAQAEIDQVGGESNAEGCYTGAGYTWCEALGKCIRIWETSCPTEKAKASRLLPSPP